MFEKLLTLIYLVGISSCGMQGEDKTKNKQFTCTKIVICILLACFAGGLVRDIFFLHTHPAILKISSLPDITIALVSAYVYRYNKSNFLFYFLIWADSLGLAQFIAIGVDKAINMDSSIFTTFLCGIVTALGGGIVSSIFCHESIKKTLSSNISYRLSAVIGTIIYMYCRYKEINHFISQYLLVCYTVSVSNKYSRNIFGKSLIKHLCILKKSFKTCSLISQYENIIYLPHYVKPLFFLPYDMYRYNNKRLDINYSKRKFICRFHRILQM